MCTLRAALSVGAFGWLPGCNGRSAADDGALPPRCDAPAQTPAFDEAVCEPPSTWAELACTGIPFGPLTGRVLAMLPNPAWCLEEPLIGMTVQVENTVWFCGRDLVGLLGATACVDQPCADGLYGGLATESGCYDTYGDLFGPDEPCKDGYQSFTEKRVSCPGRSCTVDLRWFAGSFCERPYGGAVAGASAPLGEEGRLPAPPPPGCPTQPTPVIEVPGPEGAGLPPGGHLTCGAHFVGPLSGLVKTSGGADGQCSDRPLAGMAVQEGRALFFCGEIVSVLGERGCAETQCSLENGRVATERCEPSDSLGPGKGPDSHATLSTARGHRQLRCRTDAGGTCSVDVNWL